MNKEIENKIVMETVDTIIDEINEVSREYMYDYQHHSESTDEFIKDQEEILIKVIKELNRRIEKYEV